MPRTIVSRHGVVIPYQVRSYQTDKKTHEKSMQLKSRNPLSSQVISNLTYTMAYMVGCNFGRNPLSSQVISNGRPKFLPPFRKMGRNPLSSQVISNKAPILGARGNYVCVVIPYQVRSYQTKGLTLDYSVSLFWS